MGTRADFWIGTGRDAEWLGSVGWDGYAWAEDPGCELMQAMTVEGFRQAVANIAANRDDWTAPEQGWPWPWNTSKTTDYAYYFNDGLVSFDDRDDWPDMSAKKNVTLGERSGLVIGVS